MSSGSVDCSTDPESCHGIRNNLTHHDTDHIPILLFLRHGIRLDQVPNDKIKWKDREKRYYDTPLSDYKLPIQVGQDIVKHEQTSHFKPYKIIMSPYRRCIETAAIIANIFGVTKFEIDARIGELSHDPTAGHALLPDDASYIAFGEMRSLILKHLDPKQINLNNVEIEWNHREHPGNNQWNLALLEYKNMLINNDNVNDKHLMVVSHAGIIMKLGRHTCCEQLSALKMDYCAWYAINANNHDLIAYDKIKQDMFKMTKLE